MEAGVKLSSDAAGCVPGCMKSSAVVASGVGALVAAGGRATDRMRSSRKRSRIAVRSLRQDAERAQAMRLALTPRARRWYAPGAMRRGPVTAVALAACLLAAPARTATTISPSNAATLQLKWDF